MAMVGQTTADLSAVVQRRAASMLPPGVRAMLRPDSSGARRTLQALATVPEVDLIHGLDVDLPLRNTCPTVATVHDLSVFDTPWAFSRYRAAGERMIVARAVGRADEVIAVSSFTAERIAHHFQRGATVIPLAPASNIAAIDRAAVAAVRDRYDLPPRFVLQLASIEPRKDVHLLADACTKLDLPLVLAGAVTGGQPVPSTARHLGYVPAELLDSLLDAADIVAYISRYEGFGLPPLEAMARGKAVVATAVGALPEVASKGAKLVPVGDLDALVAALEQLWLDHDHRHELARQGAEAAGRLSWCDTALATLDVYRGLGMKL